MTAYNGSDRQQISGMMGANMGPNIGGGFNQGKMDTFEQDFMMPPDIASINSEINKLNAMTPFSD